MIDYTTNNLFLKNITQLYEAKAFPKSNYFVNKYKLVKKNGKLLPRRELQKINIQAKEYYEFGLIVAELVREEELSFNTMFDFATFIRSIDKFFFYRNNSRSVKVSCPTSLDDKDVRELNFVTDSAVTINLLLKKKESIDDTVSTELIMTVYREYGKKIISKFIINDGNIVINNSDDKMLLYVITDTMRNIMVNYFIMYLDAIYNDELFDYETYKFFEPNK